MKKSILLVLPIIAVMLTSNGCKKGDTGPQGPPGTNGVDSNTNVVGTNAITLNSGNWTANGKYFYATLYTLAITQAIVDRGAVLVYEQNGSSWTALPYTFGILSRSFQFELNTVYIFYQNTDGSQTDNPGNQTYRIVAISSSNSIANPYVDWESYEEVKRVFNLNN